MKEFSLPARTLCLWRLRLCAAALPLILAASCLCLFSFVFAAAAGVLLAAFFISFFFYLPRYHKSYKISVDEGIISVTRGVILETERILPKDKVLCHRSLQTPLERVLGLYSISLFVVKHRIGLAPIDKTLTKIITDNIGGEQLERN